MFILNQLDQKVRRNGLYGFQIVFPSIIDVVTG
jgi:hypothetical protein